MKKFVAFVLVMAMAAMVNASVAGLVITTDGTTMGVSCDVPGFVLTTASLQTDVDLDWSGFATTPTYDYVPGVGLPWGGPPVVLDEAQNLFTAYTSNVTAPMGAIALFTGVALPKDWYFVDAPTATSVPINLVADVLNIGGQETSGLMDTVHAVPEPMTMSLLAVGGLVAARRRRA